MVEKLGKSVVKVKPLTVGMGKKHIIGEQSHW